MIYLVCERELNEPPRAFKTMEQASKYAIEMVDTNSGGPHYVLYTIYDLLDCVVEYAGQLVSKSESREFDPNNCWRK